MFERDIDSENDGRRERMRFWSTIVLGAILTGVVGALVVLLARANDNYDRSLGWQTQSMEVISQTRSVDAAIARAEAALGRFAVGLQKEDGRVYEYQWARARQNWKTCAKTPRTCASTKKLNLGRAATKPWSASAPMIAVVLSRSSPSCFA